MQIPSDVSSLLVKWINNAQQYSEAHLQESIILQKRHTIIGAPSVALSSIVGTSIFAGIQEAAQSVELKWILAGLSMGAAALAALVTFYNMAARAASHRIVSEEYQDVIRRLEILKTSISQMPPADWRNILEGYSQRLESIGRRADMPNSMTIITKEKRVISNGATTSGSHEITVKVRSPKVQCEGYVNELEFVYQDAIQKAADQQNINR